jgi:hypothetical protein
MSDPTDPRQLPMTVVNPAEQAGQEPDAVDTTVPLSEAFRSDWLTGGLTMRLAA